MSAKKSQSNRCTDEKQGVALPFSVFISETCQFLKNIFVIQLVNSLKIGVILSTAANYQSPVCHLFKIWTEFYQP